MTRRCASGNVSLLSLRRRLNEMPVLSATETALPDGNLFRAAAIMGIFAHAYHYVESSAYERIPDSILSPWQSSAVAYSDRHPTFRSSTSTSTTGD